MTETLMKVALKIMITLTVNLIDSQLQVLTTKEHLQISLEEIRQMAALVTLRAIGATTSKSKKMVSVALIVQEHS